MRDLKKEGRTLSSLIDEIRRYANSGERNFKLERKDEAIDALYSKYVTSGNPIKVMDFDGYRIEYPDWWFNVRKSNTEPYLRVVAEAKDQATLEKKLSEISSVIESFM